LIIIFLKTKICVICALSIATNILIIESEALYTSPDAPEIVDMRFATESELLKTNINTTAYMTQR
jgi:hypothetical protein